MRREPRKIPHGLKLSLQGGRFLSENVLLSENNGNLRLAVIIRKAASINAFRAGRQAGRQARRL